ncbi:PAS domain S-box protein [Cellulomonas sp. DKR-3]|uniref:histidine kinase n=2 Tax=Cellulomonas fulva TaxID=2835530 RepID=A0ABS5TYB7_9CELL|nr:PAS domain S-box protein [Cellulomonas fulva]
MRMVARFTGPEAGVVERQLPFLLVFLVAMGGLRLVPDVVTVPAAVLAAAATTMAVPVLAFTVPWRRLPEWAGDVLPLLELAAVALLRLGTGGQGSVFAALVFIPVLTLAQQRGRRGVVLGTVAAAAVVFAPAVENPSSLNSTVALRATVVAVVACSVAIVAHEATERLRVRNAALDRLQREQHRLLDLVRADAEVIASEAEVRRSEYDHLVSVIDSATEQAIIATDADGIVQVFNAGAERLLGYAQGAVVGRTRLTRLHDHDELVRRYAEAFGRPPRGTGEQLERRLLDAVVAPERDAAPRVRDWTYVTKDGGRLTVRLAVTRRVEPGGASTGYVVVATDVTAEREAAALKDQFVGLVSHELRTPLTAVLGYLELLQDGPDPLTDEQREFLQIVERNARRQLRLVSDLLLTAQVEAGKFAILAEPVQLDDVVRGSVASAGPAAEAAHVTLRTQVEPARVVADPTRIAQVVDNLVGNALKFTPPGGTVTVTLRPVTAVSDEPAGAVSDEPAGAVSDEPAGAELVVADTGIGIPPDEVDRLAERFFRSTTARRHAVPGVGLGLSITKAVVDAHGGSLEIASVLGEGTTLTVRLPAEPPASPAT